MPPIPESQLAHSADNPQSADDAIIQIPACSDPKITIVIPVCNVQDYLAQCLQGVLSQTLRELEVIALDDGSTDGSLRILQEFAAHDGRLRVIAKQNEGYGATINRGFAEARAPYVGIVEADDWPDPIMFETLYDACTANDCDLVKCDFYDTFEDHEEPRQNLAGLPHGTVFDSADFPQVLLIAPSTWAALYKRSFLERNGIEHRETPGAAFQDAAFSQKCLFSAHRILLLDQPLLHYRRFNENASSQSTGKLFAAADEFAAARAFFQAHPDRYDIFIRWARLNEWHNYRWEYQRIAPAGRPSFMSRVADEMRAAREAGQLDPDIFTAEEGVCLQLLLAVGPDRFCELHPDGFYACRILHPDMPDAAEDFLVSIVIPAYNDQEFVARAVRSCRRQTHANVEIICVDDCSSDATASVLHALSQEDPRVKVVEQPVNSGEHNARAAGVRHATGHLLMFLDADDELKPTTCAVVVREYLAQPYDILQYAGDVRSDGRISREEVRNMNYWMRPAFEWLVGDQIVEQCFVKYAYSHGSLYRAYPTGLVQRAFQRIGEFRANSGVDALEYFAIACDALIYRGLPDERLYVYHLGNGQSPRQAMAYEDFARALDGIHAVEGIQQYVEKAGLQEKWGYAARSHRAGQLRFLMRTICGDVREGDRPRAMARIVQDWERDEVVDAACSLGSPAVDLVRSALPDGLELTPEQALECGYVDGCRATREEYDSSISYRLGRAVTAVPRALRTAVKAVRSLKR